MDQDDDHFSKGLFLVRSQSAYNGEFSDLNVSLPDVWDVIENIILSWA